MNRIVLFIVIFNLLSRLGISELNQGVSEDIPFYIIMLLLFFS